MQLMAGRIGQEQRDRAAPKTTAVAIKVRNLHRGRHLRGIDLDIRYGEILGIAGLIGAGRTELLRAIFGADRIDSGYLKLDADEERQVFGSPEEAIAHGIGLIPEDRGRQGLLLSQSISRNVSLASQQRFRKPLGLIDTKAELDAVESYRRQLDIKCTGISQPVAELSGGNQQKVIISRWLMKDCRVLLFDEPTRGIDIQTREAIYELLDDLAAQGKAIVVVSSEIRELTTISNRIVVLSDGRVAADYQRDEWTAEKIMAASFSAFVDDNPAQLESENAR
jgi:ribose transport system ATP-binding protein